VWLGSPNGGWFLSDDWRNAGGGGWVLWRVRDYLCALGQFRLRDESGLLRALRSSTTCENVLKRSAQRQIPRNEQVRGSIPLPGPIFGSTVAHRRVPRGLLMRARRACPHQKTSAPRCINGG
jgi:hypothetical protein